MPVVRFPPGGRSIEVAAGTRLIEAIRLAGLPIASPCGDDLLCGKCGVRVLEGPVGREAAVEADAKRRNLVPEDQRLACALRVRGDMSVTTSYWGPS